MTPLEMLKEAQNFVDIETAQVGALPIQEFRFILEMTEGQRREDIERRLTDLLGSDAFILQLLFDEDDDESSEFLVLRFPRVENNFPDSDLFQMAYLLQRELSLEACEPELNTRIYADPQPDAMTGQVESNTILGRTCWVDKPAPADKLWALKTTHVDKAWQISPSKGAGVLIGQPDTGVADHDELETGSLRLDLAKNTINNTNDATDPLIPGSGNPGHGSGTSSVAVSRQAGSISGSAPGAELVPVRAIESVIVINGAPVAKAVDHARKSGCHVITMSLGGNISRSLRKAIKRAVDDDIIVMAAAGNCVRVVVFPAAYDDVIAVGGINIDDKIWKGSSRGSAVDFSAPAELVWRARHDIDNGGTPIVEGGQGTSFAVALSAGIAALWLSHFGRDAVIAEARSRSINVQELFRVAAKSTARVPAGWNASKQGAGIIDAEKLLSVPLNSIPGGNGQISTESVIASSTRTLVEEVTGESTSADGFNWEAFASEISNIILNDAKFGAFFGLPGTENNTSSVTGSNTMLEAVGQSADPALKSFFSRPRQVSQAIQRVAPSTTPPTTAAILGRNRGSPFEAAATTSEDDIKANLNSAGIREKMEQAEATLNAIPSKRADTAKSDQIKNDILRTTESALAKLRDEGDNASFTQMERVSLEALVKLDGRPAVRIENGTIDFTDPLLGEWQGQAVLLRQTIETMQASVGRINLRGGHVGTGFVVGHGLVMTNRHVLEALATPLPSPTNPSKWLLGDETVSINFSSAGTHADSSFLVKSVAFSGPDQIVNQPVDFADLDMAILEVETTNAAGNSLPPPLSLNTSDEATTRSAKLFMMGYPAMPLVLPTDSDGGLNWDVVDRLTEIFDQIYSVKYLSMGIIERMRGTLAGDPKNWVFAHDATTLGGNSGSPMIVIADGPPNIVGLHFAGDWLRANYAHSMSSILTGGGLQDALRERMNLQ